MAEAYHSPVSCQLSVQMMPKLMKLGGGVKDAFVAFLNPVSHMYFPTV